MSKTTNPLPPRAARFVRISCLTLISALTLAACATTKTALEAPALNVEVRGVLDDSDSVATPKFDVSAALAKAQKLQRQSDYTASFEAYSVALLRLKTDSDNIDENQGQLDKTQALLGLADSALALSWKNEKYQTRARKIYSELAQDADISKPHKQRARAGLLLLDLADFTPDAAQKRLQAALDLNPNDSRLWNALGKLHDGNRDWLDALDAYVSAMSVAKKNNQNTAAVVNNMGMSLLMQGRKTEALSKFRQANTADPEMPVYDNNLRLAQTLNGETEAALKGLSDIRAAQIYNDAGVIAEAQGQTEKAAKLYEKALDTSPVYFERAEKNLSGLAAKIQLSASLD